jgi:signal transduction histidine kinase
LRTCLAHPEQTQTSQYRFRHKDGSWRYLESKSNFSLSNPSLTGIVVNSRDITARKQAEEETRKALQKAQELHEAKSRFVSMVSHEIRNPLHGILAATQILERYSEKWSTEKKQEFFHRIKIGVRKMTDLLDNVLIMGRAEQRRLEAIPVPINLESFSRNLIEEIKQDTSSKQKIVFEKRCAVDDANQCQCKKAYQDEKLLRHILNNLLSNAIKYSPPNSTIHFSLSCHNDEVIFEIKDEGIGIPPEDQQHLFESFHRATNVNNIPGTGIGLAIVKRCVEVQGGKIAVTSQVGVGSTFTVTLPLLNPVSKNAGAIV